MVGRQRTSLHIEFGSMLGATAKSWSEFDADQQARKRVLLTPCLPHGEMANHSHASRSRRGCICSKFRGYRRSRSRVRLRTTMWRNSLLTYRKSLGSNNRWRGP